MRLDFRKIMLFAFAMSAIVAHQNCGNPNFSNGESATPSDVTNPIKDPGTDPDPGGGPDPDPGGDPIVVPPGDFTIALDCTEIKNSNHWSCPRISNQSGEDYYLYHVVFTATITNAKTVFQTQSHCWEGTVASPLTQTLAWVYGDPRFEPTIPVEEWDPSNPSIPISYGGNWPRSGKQQMVENAPVESLVEQNECRKTVQTNAGGPINWFKWPGKNSNNWGQCYCQYRM